MPVLVSNIPFLIGPLYEERGGRQNRPSLFADVVGNPQEDSHMKVMGMLAQKFKCGCEHQQDRGSVYASKPSRCLGCISKQTGQALLREENKVEFLEKQFHKEKLSLAHKKKTELSFELSH